jgi:hypothetical protein
MALPRPVETLWSELQAVRGQVLVEVEGLSQRQADWRPGDKDWSVGEIVHHLTLAEVGTGKLTSKLTKEAAASGGAAVFPADLTEFPPLPAGPVGPAEAPPVVWPEAAKPIAELIAGLAAARERSRESVEKLGRTDPRKLVYAHFRLGDLDLAQWWQLHVRHEGIHLAQIRDVKRAPGFPRS